MVVATNSIAQIAQRYRPTLPAMLARLVGMEFGGMIGAAGMVLLEPILAKSFQNCLMTTDGANPNRRDLIARLLRAALLIYLSANLLFVALPGTPDRMCWPGSL
jgi:hypothetical protein